MAHKLYFDNVSTSTATLNDGVFSEGTNPGGGGNNVFTFSDASTITNESRAIDRNTTDAMTNFSRNLNSETGAITRDSLQFDFGSSKSIDFVALFFNAAETDSIGVHHDDAATGEVTNIGEFTADFTEQWNIRSFTKTANRYWHVSAFSGAVNGITEIFFGTEFILPIDGNSITISKPFNSFTASSYNNVEYSNKIDTEKLIWKIQLPIITEADKTNLELLQSHYSNIYSFVYYDESEYHSVRLVNPLQFNQIAINTYSTTITLREE